MPDRLADQIMDRLNQIEGWYYRLLLVVAPSGTGKTAALEALATRIPARLVNVNLALSERLLDLTERQRALQVPRFLGEVVGPGSDVVLLDNIEILFDVSLKQDPLRLLQGLSRSRPVVASWNGTVEGGHLTYACADHPEYRRYPAREIQIVSPSASD